jgi:hypothetical protein
MQERGVFMWARGEEETSFMSIRCQSCTSLTALPVAGAVVLGAASAIAALQRAILLWEGEVT